MRFWMINSQAQVATRSSQAFSPSQIVIGVGIGLVIWGLVGLIMGETVFSLRSRYMQQSFVIFRYEGRAMGGVLLIMGAILSGVGAARRGVLPIPISSQLAAYLCLFTLVGGFALCALLLLFSPSQARQMDHRSVPFMTIPEAAAFLRLSEQDVRTLTADHHLIARHIDDQIVFDREVLYAFKLRRKP